MRKYFQITFFLGGFFLLVLLKNLKGNDSENRIVGTPQQQGLLLTATATSAPSVSQSVRSAYKDGTYTGSVEDVYYGNYQVQAVIVGGKLADINFLQYPNDNRTSRSINSQAMPILKSEAISAQSAQVDTVSGASDSSGGFQKSLENALKKAT